MHGAAMTRRSPTASTEETVTSYTVLTSCPASKFISQSVPHPLSHHCVAPPVSPPSLCPSLFLSVSACLWCHCCWSLCLPFPGDNRSHTHLQPTWPLYHVWGLLAFSLYQLKKYSTSCIHLFKLWCPAPKKIRSFKSESACEMGRKAEVLSRISRTAKTPLDIFIYLITNENNESKVF